MTLLNFAYTQLPFWLSSTEIFVFPRRLIRQVPFCPGIVILIKLVGLWNLSTTGVIALNSAFNTVMY